jgi:hypothetical protein
MIKNDAPFPICLICSDWYKKVSKAFSDYYVQAEVMLGPGCGVINLRPLHKKRLDIYIYIYIYIYTRIHIFPT